MHPPLPTASPVHLSPAPKQPADQIAGNLITFNDNGAWCWYQDRRVIIDPANQTMLISSIADSAGADGARRTGNVELVTYQFATGARQRIVLHQNLQPEDDHNTPSLLIRPDGKYLAMYATHNQDNYSYWRISTRPHDAGEWSTERRFDWTAKIGEEHVTYSNLFYLPAQKRIYNFARAVNRDPSILVSQDLGESWSYGGKLLTIPKLGYVNGYTKYASNGVDRIDFITTEHHPRDFNNNIYHGFIQGGKLRRSDGVVDEKIPGSTGHPQTELTKIFPAGSVFNGDIITRAWTIQIEIDAGGLPYALFSARANHDGKNPKVEDLRFFYARFDGTAWKVFQLAKAGAGLWDFEQDYTGLGALVPGDPNVVFISTNIDPRDDRLLDFHEIFKGITSDGGQSWAWQAITRDSTVENLRPIVPPGDPGRTALLWFRGKMTSSQNYDCAIVGMIDQPDEHYGPVCFNHTNEFSGLGQGVHDFFAFFWAGPNEDVAIEAGLAADQLMAFRRQACQQAEASQFDGPITLVDGKRAMYRAFVGKMEVRSGQPIRIFASGSALAGFGSARIVPTAK
jgi:hypothetical protein